MISFHVYRVFRYYAREVWSCELPEGIALLLQHSDKTPLKYMLSKEPPIVYPKSAIPILARQLSNCWDQMMPMRSYGDTRRLILNIIAAYPASYHHAARQEMGIGFGVGNNPFEDWPYYRWLVMQENGNFHGDYLDRNELATRKRNRKKRPKGVPDHIWREL